MSRKKDVQEQERIYNENIEKWLKYNSKEALDEVFYRVYECCKANALKYIKTKGLKECPNFDDKVMDATIMVMESIKKGVIPKKLSSFCYTRMLYNLLKHKNEEKEVSYELYVDNNEID